MRELWSSREQWSSFMLDDGFTLVRLWCISLGLHGESVSRPSVSWYFLWSILPLPWLLCELFILSPLFHQHRKCVNALSLHVWCHSWCFWTSKNKLSSSITLVIQRNVQFGSTMEVFILKLWSVSPFSGFIPQIWCIIGLEIDLLRKACFAGGDGETWCKHYDW